MGEKHAIVDRFFIYVITSHALTTTLRKYSTFYDSDVSVVVVDVSV